MNRVNNTEDNYGLNLALEGDFKIGHTRFDHSTGYEREIFYVKGGTVCFYLCTGDDQADLERDWAFEFAGLFKMNKKVKSIVPHS